MDRVESQQVWISGECIRKATIWTKPKSALNLSIISIDDNSRSMYLVGYVHPEADEDRRRYYEPAFFKGSNVIGYVSITIRDLMKKKGLNLEFCSIDRKIISIDIDTLKIDERRLRRQRASLACK